MEIGNKVKHYSGGKGTIISLKEIEGIGWGVVKFENGLTISTNDLLNTKIWKKLKW